jgi:hypothetical protein
MSDSVHNMSRSHGTGEHRLKGDSVSLVDFEYYSILTQILFGLPSGTSTSLRIDSTELPVGATLGRHEHVRNGLEGHRPVGSNQCKRVSRSSRCGKRRYALTPYSQSGHEYTNNTCIGDGQFYLCR